MKALLAAVALFASLAAGLAIAWTLFLAVAMEPVWSRLPDAAAPWVGASLLAFAVGSGLALYFVLLGRTLRALRIAPGRLKLHLLTTGLVPPVAAALAAWAAVATMRIGW